MYLILGAWDSDGGHAFADEILIFPHDRIRLLYYHHGYYFHVICPFDPPETWEHGEFDNSNGDPTPVRFAFYWVDLDAVPLLQGWRGEFLDALRMHLRDKIDENK